MPTIEELSHKIERLEQEQRRRSRLFLVYWVGPLLFLVVGFFLIREIRQAQEQWQRLELEVNQIKVAQDKLVEFFPVTLEPDFAADLLKSKVLDDNLSEEIPVVGTPDNSQGVNQQLLEKDWAGVPRTAAAVETAHGPTARAGSRRSPETLYYIVVASVAPENGASAVKGAEELRMKGYRSSVHETESGYLVVTLGPVPLDQAEVVLADAVLRNDVKDDSFLTEGKSFSKQVYPK